MSERLRREDWASEHLVRLGLYETRVAAVKDVKAGKWEILLWGDEKERLAKSGVKYHAKDIVCFIDRRASR